MPKQKRHKGLTKRFHVTARGKVVYKKANANHLMSGKSGDRKRKLRRAGVIGGPIADRMKTALLED